MGSAGLAGPAAGACLMGSRPLPAAERGQRQGLAWALALGRALPAPSSGLCPRSPEAATGARLWRGQRARCCLGSRGAALQHSWAVAPLAPPQARGAWAGACTSHGRQQCVGLRLVPLAAALGRDTAASPVHTEHSGQAPSPGCGWSFQAVLTRQSLNFNACCLVSSCSRSLLFRKRAAPSSALQEA